MVTCIIFDCDGVLVDSEMIAARVAADCFTEAGMPITAEELTRRFSGIAGDQVTVQLAAQFGVVPDAAMTEKRRHRIMTAFASELQAITGVDCALESLGQEKCVASSSHPERIALSLRLTGVERHFGERVYSSSMVSRGKPAPDLFLYAAAQLGHVPSNCLVVEDSVHGVAAAKVAGMRIFGFTGGSHCSGETAGKLRAAGADSVFHEMRELPSLVARAQAIHMRP